MQQGGDWSLTRHISPLGPGHPSKGRTTPPELCRTCGQRALDDHMDCLGPDPPDVSHSSLPTPKGQAGGALGPDLHFRLEVIGLRILCI